VGEVFGLSDKLFALKGEKTYSYFRKNLGARKGKTNTKAQRTSLKQPALMVRGTPGC
jgi:hypothetical protein